MSAQSLGPRLVERGEGGMACRALMHPLLAFLCCRFLFVVGRNVPRDFNSTVHPLSSSCTSSGSTCFLVQASSQRGLGGWAGTAPFVWSGFLDFFGVVSPPLLLPLNLEKNPMLRLWGGDGINPLFYFLFFFGLGTLAHAGCCRSSDGGD